jgi:hypothetical protein
MTTMDKTRLALRTLDQRLGESWERAELEKGPKFPKCKVRMDRLVVTTAGFYPDVAAAIPQFVHRRKHFLKRRRPEDVLPYARVAELESRTSIERMFALTEPQLRGVAPCKITLIAKDRTGLKAKDVRLVLGPLPDVKVAMLELAWDFRRGSGIDGAYIRRHGVFGKSRQRNVAVVHCYDSWGSRKSVFIRSYYKETIHAHRLELQFNRGFLRRHKIQEIDDFWRLANSIPIHQILFAELNELKLISWLRNRGYRVKEVLSVMRKVIDEEGNLLAQCRVLRREAGLQNLHRFLARLPTNELVKLAVRTWVKQWPREA